MKIINQSIELDDPPAYEDMLFKIEMAARNCYQSKSKGQSEEFISNLIKRGHHCYDDATEVLTENGFKKFQNISSVDKVAVFNTENRTLIGFEFPKDIIKEVYDGDLFFYDTPCINLAVTPNHRIYCSLSSTQRKRINPKFELIEAGIDISPLKKVFSSPMRMAKVASGTVYKNILNPFNFTNFLSFCKLVGFFAGGGSYLSSRRVVFHLKKERKILYLLSICKDLGIECKAYKNNTYILTYENIGKWFKENCFSINKEKKLPDCCLYLSEDCLLSLIDGLKNSDGSIKKNRKDEWSFTNTSFVLVNQFQAITSLIGQVFNMKDKILSDKKTLYTLGESTRKIFPHLNDSRNPSVKAKIIQYKGYVYCVTTTTGLIMVRRNGKTVLSGNSPLEHCSLTFKIVTDRAVLAELSRHRLLSLQVESQRYVRYNDVTFIRPVWLVEDGGQDYNIFKISCQESEQNYLNLIKVCNKKPQEARIVLTNATKSDIICTTNIREWRYIFNLRTTPENNPQFRELMLGGLKVVKDKYPIFFKDINAIKPTPTPTNGMCYNQL